MLPPDEIIAQVELNPDGLALYRLGRIGEVSIPEARRLIKSAGVNRMWSVSVRQMVFLQPSNASP